MSATNTLLRRNLGQAQSDFFEGQGPFPQVIPFPHSTPVNRILGYAVVYGRPTFSVQIGSPRNEAATVAAGSATFGISVQGSNRPVRPRLIPNGVGEPTVAPPHLAFDGDYDEIDTLTEADISQISFVTGPVWIVRFKLTAVASYSAGALELWVL